MMAYCDEVDENVAVAEAPRSDFDNRHDGMESQRLQNHGELVVEVPPQAWWPAALAWLWCCTTLFAVYTIIFVALINRARGND